MASQASYSSWFLPPPMVEDDEDSEEELSIGLESWPRLFLGCDWPSLSAGKGEEGSSGITPAHCVRVCVCI